MKVVQIGSLYYAVILSDDGESFTVVSDGFPTIESCFKWAKLHETVGFGG